MLHEVLSVAEIRAGPGGSIKFSCHALESSVLVSLFEVLHSADAEIIEFDY